MLQLSSPGRAAGQYQSSNGQQEVRDTAVRKWTEQWCSVDKFSLCKVLSYYRAVVNTLQLQ